MRVVDAPFDAAADYIRPAGFVDCSILCLWAERCVEVERGVALVVGIGFVYDKLPIPANFDRLARTNVVPRSFPKRSHSAVHLHGFKLGRVATAAATASSLGRGTTAAAGAAATATARVCHESRELAGRPTFSTVIRRTEPEMYRRVDERR